MSTRTSFTTVDLANGLTPDFLLGLIDDVKWRDGALKAIQYFFKVNGAFISEYNLVENSKELTADLDFAAGTISTARRCFRFLRWLRFAHTFPSDVNQKSLIDIVLKSIHHIASISACVFEDITTLGRLKLVSKEFASRFDAPGVYAWFTESFTGLIIQTRVIQQKKNIFVAAKAEWKASIAKRDSALIRQTACNAFAKWSEFHFAQVTLLKWAAETAASANDMGYHNNTKFAYLSSFTSAVVSTYVQSAKLWKA